MREGPDGTIFAATDLGAFLECQPRTLLDLRVLKNELVRPGQNEIERELLARRGLAHEARVLEHYRASGLRIVEVKVPPGAEGHARALELTVEALRAGADVIYQGALGAGSWAGRPDFLLRSREAGGHFGQLYEVVDAKLSRETRARAVLQLCVYTDALAELQGTPPRYFHVAQGGEDVPPRAFLARDYLAYFRGARARFEAFVAEVAAEPYPEPVEHCEVCPWWKRCEDRRRADDHLSLVANITRRQRERLHESGLQTLAALGGLAPGNALTGIMPHSLERLRQQAALQLEARTSGRPASRLIEDVEPGLGLEQLPLPTPGDLFLDLEGDQFVNRGEGLEYLFGWVELGEPASSLDFSAREEPGPARYHAAWASSRTEEKQAFEAVIDRIWRGRDEFPALHVYHYGHREADAIRKLSCRHATREREVDELLRRHVLVDLARVVRRALVASVEGYTLKQLEPFHGFVRRTELRAAARAMQLFGWWLETADPALDLTEPRLLIESYNREDCLSTVSLRDWLEAERPVLGRLLGRKLTRPVPPEPVVAEPERDPEKAALVRKLLAGLPETRELDDAAQAPRRLLADLLDWHHRENKSGFWEYFRAIELAPDERLADRAVLAELSYQGVVAQVKSSQVHRYAFPPQEHALRKQPTPVDPATQKPAGTVVEIALNHLDLKRSGRSQVAHPSSLIAGGPLKTLEHEQSLLAIATAFSDGTPQFAAARALLTRAPPRAGQTPGSALLAPEESLEHGLERLVLALDQSVLAVQGPPGTGKTYQAARAILALMRAGRRVGVTANSHAVIKNLLKKVVELDPTSASRVLHLQDEDAESGATSPFAVHNKKEVARAALDSGAIALLGGTSWTWVTPRFAESVDVLVIDEAGQMALANALAVSRAAQSLLLVGDPAQLEQPQKGVHPPGADVSVLAHSMGGDALTVPPERGVFLPHTRRMHPLVCEFISGAFYEQRLLTHPTLGLERQAVLGPARLSGAGLRYAPVVHRGNGNTSDEEVARVRELVKELFAGSPEFVSRDGEARPLAPRDVLVVAPYNAQVAALRRALPAEIEVGTVDKFQGKEAPVVIYSMTTSSAADAPRGLEFLYSRSRLNVAISRAQALSILVASPELPRAACKTPAQLRLVNALCQYLELARVL